jgi:hypothetical protein
MAWNATAVTPPPIRDRQTLGYRSFFDRETLPDLITRRIVAGRLLLPAVVKV